MNVKEGVLESCSSQDTELKLPDQVRFVRTGAFDKANEVRIVIGRQVRGIEGREKDWERHLSGKACVFPMLEPSDVLGEDAASLICGFCLYPDLYANSEGYLTALKSMREEVLSLAASLGILVSVNRCLRKNGIGLTQAEILGRVDWTDPFELARLAGRQNWEAKALYAEGAVLSLSPPGAGSGLAHSGAGSVLGKGFDSGRLLSGQGGSEGSPGSWIQLAGRFGSVLGPLPKAGERHG